MFEKVQGAKRNKGWQSRFDPDIFDNLNFIPLPRSSWPFFQGRMVFRD